MEKLGGSEAAEFGMVSNVEGFKHSKSILSSNSITFKNLKIIVDGIEVVIDKIEFSISSKGYNTITGVEDYIAAVSTSSGITPGPAYQLRGLLSKSEITTERGVTYKLDSSGRMKKGWVYVTGSNHEKLENILLARTKRKLLEDMKVLYKGNQSTINKAKLWLQSNKIINLFPQP